MQPFESKITLTTGFVCTTELVSLVHLKNQSFCFVF